MPTANSAKAPTKQNNISHLMISSLPGFLSTGLGIRLRIPHFSKMICTSTTDTDIEKTAIG